MKKNILMTMTLVAVMLGVQNQLFAQEAVKPRPSPLAVTTMSKGDAYVKVVYSQPHKRDRKVFGGDLVPYDKVWRLGANEATEITLTEDMMFGDEKLEAGTYSMYAIPGKKEWTIIFNEALGQWGAYNYDEEKDVARISVPVEKAETTYEPFTIKFSEDQSQMMMMWDDTMVSIPVSPASA
jgi:hypothetical protein